MIWKPRPTGSAPSADFGARIQALVKKIDVARKTGARPPEWVFGLSMLLLAWRRRMSEGNVTPRDEQGVIAAFERLVGDDPLTGAGSQPPSATRPWVDVFADEMERRLEQNRDKGDREGWRKASKLALLTRLRDEVEELADELDAEYESCGCRTTGECNHDDSGCEERVLAEAADVANFAMMIADVAGGLRPRETS